MDTNNSQNSDGVDRNSPQNNSRGAFSYTPRQTTYHSMSSSRADPQPTPTTAKLYKPASFDMLPVTQKPKIPFTQTQTPRIESISSPGQPTDLPKISLDNSAGSFADKQFFEKPKHKSRVLSLSAPKILAVGVVIATIGGGVFFASNLLANKDNKAEVKSATSEQTKKDSDGGISEGDPDESGFPPSVGYYRTANTYPRVIRIAKTKTEARVLALGIATTGALKAPGNIFDAGWYKDSAKPGEAGAMVVDGHVSGPTKPGIFKNLGTLVKDDKIEIERGDGKKFTYTVTAVKVFDADKLDMSSVMVSSVSGKPALNIITCGGKFDKATNKYEQRTVVYAVL